MATIQKQVRMVFDLNKCLGCQACTMACKTMWTDRDVGSMYMYWNNVETRPGRGYPRNWFMAGSDGQAGIAGCEPSRAYDKLRQKVVTANSLGAITAHYGAPWEYNYFKVLKTAGGKASDKKLNPSPPPNSRDAYAANWDEDVGANCMPNTYYFYLPRICNHCTKPACLAACPRQSVYKRKEDGIVLIDQNRCRGYRYCVKGCPYKKIYYNPDEGTIYPDYPNPKTGAPEKVLWKKSQKCIFCYPRIQHPSGFPTGRHSFCFTQCVGRIRYAGFVRPNEEPLSKFNKQFNVNRLVYEFKVAVRLHPEFGTEPNLFYIPPLSPPTFDQSGNPSGKQRIPVELLASLFGDNCDQTFEERIARIKEIFEKLDAARKGDYPELQKVLIAHSESDRLQLDLAFES